MVADGEKKFNFIKKHFCDGVQCICLLKISNVLPPESFVELLHNSSLSQGSLLLRTFSSLLLKIVVQVSKRAE